MLCGIASSPPQFRGSVFAFDLAGQHFTLFARGVASNSDSSFSYGMGLQYQFNGSWYAQADYVSYYDKNGDTIRGPSLGVGLRF